MKINERQDKLKTTSCRLHERQMHIANIQIYIYTSEYGEGNGLKLK